MFLYGAILGLVKSHGVPPIPSSSAIGFTAVKNTDCLHFLRLPPGINPCPIIEFNSLAFPTRLMYSLKPFGNSILSCNSGSIAFSVNVLELLEGTRIDWKSLDSSKIGIFS